MREMVEMHYLLTDPLLMDDGALQSLMGYGFGPCAVSVLLALLY